MGPEQAGTRTENFVQAGTRMETQARSRPEPERKPRTTKKNEKSVLLEVVINRFVLEYKIPEGNQSRNQKKKVLTRTEPERKCSLNETRTDFFLRSGDRPETDIPERKKRFPA